MTAGRSKKQCNFCVDKNTFKESWIDYKNIFLLRRYMSQYARIVPKYYSGICLRHQKKIANEVKRAREMALLAYVR